MTLALLQPSTATPTQRNRRLLLSMSALAVPVLSACGGGADLSYDTEQALYVVGEAITPNNPQLTTSSPNTAGHTAPTFSVWPALPVGLSLNTKTGVISGTPNQLRRQGTHTIIARNNRGFAETQVRITVTGRGAWSPLAAMSAPRHSASIASLRAGKFLVVGGRVSTQGLASAEIFDSATGTWSLAASMHLARTMPLAVSLPSGRVLVLGGARSDNAGMAEAEVYDPVSNTWTQTASMHRPRAGATAHVLPNGMVLVAGGYTHTAFVYEFHDSVELYDPGTESWTLLPTPMTSPRAGHAGVLLAGGTRLLMVGGTGMPGPGSSAEIYALDGSGGGAFPYDGNPVDTKGVLLDDGSVLTVADGSNLSRRFYPRTSKWTTSPLSSASVSRSLVLLGDGRVLLTGGSELNTAQIFNPDVNIWTEAAPMLTARRAAVAALLGDGSVLMVSGLASQSVVNASERYSP